MSVMPWRCDRTGNPVGTDTVMVGAPPCKCQGCRAYAAVTSLRAQNDELRTELAQTIARCGKLQHAIVCYLADDFSCNGGAEIMFRAALGDSG